MTIIVGIYCTDGVVIGSDSSATFGPFPTAPTIEQPVQKIYVVQNRFIVAATGQIGASQRFIAAIDSAWTSGLFKACQNKPPQATGSTPFISLAHNPTDYGKLFCRIALEDFGSTGMQKGQLGALVAFPAKDQHHLCEFGLADFQPELKSEKLWFSSMGSGQSITDPFLGLMRRVFFKSGRPNLKEGMFLATWALQNAIELNPAGINGPPQLATLTFDGKREPHSQILEASDLEEHKNSVEAAERHLAEYVQILAGKNAPALPTAPSKTS